MKTLALKKGKEAAISRRHPWIFSGAIASNQPQPENGEVVTITDYRDNFIARGHYHQGSIAVRILTHMDEQIDQQFANQRISDALELRNAVGIGVNDETTVFRLINAEGDGLPGLIIDWYNEVAVIEFHTDGMIQMQEMLVEALKAALGEKLQAVYCKSEGKIPYKANFAFGEATVPHIVNEYGNQFEVDWESGQKTGFFIDQRENRKLLGALCKGKRVLNAFSYSGGFSIYALKNGAEYVHSVDASEPAIELANKNAELNGVAEKHEGIAQDVFDYMKSHAKEHDIIIIDPPAFAKSLRKRHNAVIGYKRLNKLAIDSVKSGGMVFTFSCSQVVDQKLFEDTVRAAGIETGRRVRVLTRVTQPADHPVNLFHPEGSYLKGLLLKVD